MMESERNSTEMNHGSILIVELEFVLVIVTLTLITMCIFCTIYRINADDEPIIRFHMGGGNSLRIAAPPNTQNDL